MPDPKTVTLRVVMPDPGEWCLPKYPDARTCRHWYGFCALGHSVTETTGDQWFGFLTALRPQSCRDAEVKT